MPSKQALQENGIDPNTGAAVKMEPGDHQQTASNGNTPEADAYREKQAELIRQGKYDEAQQMDVNDLQTKFKKKYDQGIQQAQDYAQTLPEGQTQPSPSAPSQPEPPPNQ